MNLKLATVILAAGKGTRMRSEIPKVLHRLGGIPLLAYPLELARGVGSSQTIVVVGHGAEEVEKQLSAPDLPFVIQEKQNGTADAVKVALKTVDRAMTHLLVLCGDAPLLREQTLKKLVQKHQKSRAVLTVLTAKVSNPQGYGRIVRDNDRTLLKVVEELEATPIEKKIGEVNSGVICFQTSFLRKFLPKVQRSSTKKEYYLTDLIAIAIKKGLQVESTLGDEEEILGINDRVDLARADAILNQRIVEQWMRSGVTIWDPPSVRIDRTVTLEPDVIVHPGTHLLGTTQIHSGSEIGPYAWISDSFVGRFARIYPFSVIEKSEIQEGVRVGPSAHLREGAILEEGVRVGNFVEIKKSRLGKGTKAAHLSYLGNAEIGAKVNVGCGTITCNYDGAQKHPTVVEEGAFIGSDTQLVAPVRVGRNAYIGSGSTITKDVPAGALAVARGEQKIIEGWSERRRNKLLNGRGE
ncbi:MAG: bifunctional UDP-N-acetylglucosamine diphosphorylase/glucosamine-1-phosphate N-acetyltransferase GlmU [Deltaproteobacteria bacterium]|nr:bifunctional UDP-N-acetylglucosamine diphosphorylase/glucosamine-1-phosphate N-acetyltransferase GlmU [Deltaproteobacteria bacterium]